MKGYILGTTVYLVVFVTSAIITKAICNILHISEAVNSDAMFIAAFATIYMMIVMCIGYVVATILDDLSNKQS